MHILHIISGLRQSAGTSTFVCEVCNRLSRKGHDVMIAVKNPATCGNKNLLPGIRLISFRDIILNTSFLDNANVVHIHALWNPMLSLIAVLASRRKCPIVWSTHGMTAPWSMAYKRMKKWIPWHLYQKPALSLSALIHATTEQEVMWNRDLGFVNNQIVAPLGTDVPPTQELETTKKSGEVLSVLFVGRICQVKGLMNVVRAAEDLRDAPIRFRIVGPDEAGYQASLMEETGRLGVATMFEWVGPKYGEALAEEYNACDLLILPSFTENFGVTVVDALVHGKPALTSRFTPWKILEDRECGWWVSNEPKALAEAFKRILSCDRDDLHLMGARGRKLVTEHYTWEAVCGVLEKGYDMLCG